MPQLQQRSCTLAASLAAAPLGYGSSMRVAPLSGSMRVHPLSGSVCAPLAARAPARASCAAPAGSPHAPRSAAPHSANFASLLSPRMPAPPPSCQTPGQLWFEKPSAASRFGASPGAAVIAPGDVLNIKGDGNLMDIGVNGGFFGHAVLVSGVPELVSEKSELRESLGEHWPSSARSLLKVPTIESCRASAGLHKTELLIHQHSGRFDLVGEVDADGDLSYYFSSETVEVWQSPPELRGRFCTRTMQRVLEAMSAAEADWSYATAVRALLRPAALSLDSDDTDLVAQAQASWTAAPICTSVPIVFWQRYLCQIAKSSGSSEAAFIRRWMPVSADRTLPTELSVMMKRCGWCCAYGGGFRL